jgi:hypothetical protein
MALFRVRRDQRGPDRWLTHKMVLFAIGAVVAFAGMVTERSWLVNIGIVVLVIGVALRFIGRHDVTVDEIDDGAAAEDDPDHF